MTIVIMIIMWMLIDNYVMTQCILVLVVKPANFCLCFVRRSDEALSLFNALCSNNQTNHANTAEYTEQHIPRLTQSSCLEISAAESRSDGNWTASSDVLRS